MKYTIPFGAIYGLVLEEFEKIEESSKVQELRRDRCREWFVGLHGVYNINLFIPVPCESYPLIPLSLPAQLSRL